MAHVFPDYSTRALILKLAYSSTTLKNQSKNKHLSTLINRDAWPGTGFLSHLYLSNLFVIELNVQPNITILPSNSARVAE